MTSSRGTRARPARYFPRVLRNDASLHLSFPSFLVEAVARATTREETSWFVKFKTISKILLNLFFFREIWIESEELRLINGDVCCRVYYVDKIKQLSYI